MRQLTYAGFFLVMLGILSSCAQPMKYPDTPEGQIVQELPRRRIILLGDFAHEFPLSLNSLTKTLSFWLAMLEEGASEETHMTLFLEMDRQEASLVSDYLRTGNISPLLDFVLPSTSFESLEFYADLRRIALRIDSLNGTLAPPRQITFRLEGPEAMNVFDVRMLDSSQRAGLLYYVKTRDSLTAANIIGSLNEHPLQKALAFYGNGHLIKRVVTKDTWGMLDPDEREGKYVAWYLKKEYGDSQVFAVSQVAQSSLPPGTRDFGQKSRFVLAENVPWHDVEMENESLIPQNFDAFLVRQEPVTPRHPLGKIFSRRIIAACIRRMDLLEPHLGGAMGKRYYEQAREAVMFLSDTSFSHARDWQSWWAGHPFDVYERLRSIDFQRQMANEFYQNFDPKHLQDLEDLGFGPRFGNLRTMTREEWGRAFEKIWPEIVFLNSIGVYWVGDPDEKDKAKRYLAVASGHDYESPDQYLKWWRRQYLSVVY